MRSELVAQPTLPRRQEAARPGVLHLLDQAYVPSLAFDARGIQVYENAASAKLLGHGLGEYDQQHVLEIVAHEPEWTYREFERLKTSGRWRGQVSMAHKTQGPIVSEGKAVVTLQAGNEPLYLGLLRPIREATPEKPGNGIGAYGLSTQEAIVLQLMAEGLSDREIALLLSVSVWTVHKQSGAVLRKMDATSRTLAAIRAVREGLA
ncbi:MAG TPA: LuxR C-terminal-related transcriptional regulator [Dehalococcoidia bacterium]|nr:LuxR C-terminal-related transcriptional regulator [Dehalococcoidia bacterium]